MSLPFPTMPAYPTSKNERKLYYKIHHQHHDQPIPHLNRYVATIIPVCLLIFIWSETTIRKKDGVIDQIGVTDLSIYYVCNFLSFTFMVTVHYAWNVDVDMICEIAWSRCSFIFLELLTTCRVTITSIECQTKLFVIHTTRRRRQASRRQ